MGAKKKESKDKVIGIRVSLAQQKQLQTLSDKTCVSQSTLVRVALRRFFEDMDSTTKLDKEMFSV